MVTHEEIKITPDTLTSSEIPFFFLFWQLLALDLSHNRIRNLECYSRLPAECRSLKGLDLSSNEIRSLQELEHMQGMSSVVEISLKGNPCEEQARDFASYSSSIRKYFPNLERLVSENSNRLAIDQTRPHPPSYLQNRIEASCTPNRISRPLSETNTSH